MKDYIKDEIGNCDFKFTIDLQNLKVVNTNQTYDGDVLIDLADTLKITLVGMNDNRYYKSRTNLEIEFYQTEYNANLSGIFDKETFETAVSTKISRQTNGFRLQVHGQNRTSFRKSV